MLQTRMAAQSEKQRHEQSNPSDADNKFPCHVRMQYGEPGTIVSLWNRPYDSGNGTGHGALSPDSGQITGQPGSYSRSEDSLGHSGLLSPDLWRNRKLGYRDRFGSYCVDQDMMAFSYNRQP